VTTEELDFYNDYTDLNDINNINNSLFTMVKSIHTNEEDMYRSFLTLDVLHTPKYIALKFTEAHSIENIDIGVIKILGTFDNNEGKNYTGIPNESLGCFREHLAMEDLLKQQSELSSTNLELQRQIND